MKKLLFLLFYLPLFVFGQHISIKDIRSISSTDSETFEIFCMKRDYKFHSIDKDDNGVYDGLTMRYFDGTTTRYVTYYNYFFNLKKCFNYQTSSASDLLKIYEELKSLGFKLIGRSQQTDHVEKNYENNYTKEKINIFLFKTTTEIGYMIE